MNGHPDCAFAGRKAQGGIADGCAFDRDRADDLALADGLEQAIYDPEVREDLVARGRSRIANYSWDATARGMLDLYRRVAAS